MWQRRSSSGSSAVMANLSAPNYGSLRSNANWGPVPTSTGGATGTTEGLQDHSGTTSSPQFTEPSCVNWGEEVVLLRRQVEAAHNWNTWQMYEENTGEPSAKRMRAPNEKDRVDRVKIWKTLTDGMLKTYSIKPERCFLAQKNFKMIVEKPGLINSDRRLYVRDVDTVLFASKK